MFVNFMKGRPLAAFEATQGIQGLVHLYASTNDFNSLLEQLRKHQEDLESTVKERGKEESLYFTPTQSLAFPSRQGVSSPEAFDDAVVADLKQLARVALNQFGWLPSLLCPTFHIPFRYLYGRPLDGSRIMDARLGVIILASRLCFASVENLCKIPSIVGGEHRVTERRPQSGPLLRYEVCSPSAFNSQHESESQSKRTKAETTRDEKSPTPTPTAREPTPQSSVFAVTPFGDDMGGEATSTSPTPPPRPLPPVRSGEDNRATQSSSLSSEVVINEQLPKAVINITAELGINRTVGVLESLWLNNIVAEGAQANGEPTYTAISEESVSVYSSECSRFVNIRVELDLASFLRQWVQSSFTTHESTDDKPVTQITSLSENNACQTTEKQEEQLQCNPQSDSTAIRATSEATNYCGSEGTLGSIGTMPTSLHAHSTLSPDNHRSPSSNATKVEGGSISIGNPEAPSNELSRSSKSSSLIAPEPVADMGIKGTIFSTALTEDNDVSRASGEVTQTIPSAINSIPKPEGFKQDTYIQTSLPTPDTAIENESSLKTPGQITAIRSQVSTTANSLLLAESKATAEKSTSTEPPPAPSSPHRPLHTFAVECAATPSGEAIKSDWPAVTPLVIQPTVLDRNPNPLPVACATEINSQQAGDLVSLPHLESSVCEDETPIQYWPPPQPNVETNSRRSFWHLKKPRWMSNKRQSKKRPSNANSTSTGRTLVRLTHAISKWFICGRPVSDADPVSIPDEEDGASNQQSCVISSNATSETLPPEPETQSPEDSNEPAQSLEIAEPLPCTVRTPNVEVTVHPTLPPAITTAPLHLQSTSGDVVEVDVSSESLLVRPYALVDGDHFAKTISSDTRQTGKTSLGAQKSIPALRAASKPIEVPMAAKLSGSLPQNNANNASPKQPEQHLPESRLEIASFVSENLVSLSTTYALTRSSSAWQPKDNSSNPEDTNHSQPKRGPLTPSHACSLPTERPALTKETSKKLASSMITSTLSKPVTPPIVRSEWAAAARLHSPPPRPSFRSLPMPSSPDTLFNVSSSAIYSPSSKSQQQDDLTANGFDHLSMRDEVSIAGNLPVRERHRQTFIETTAAWDERASHLGNNPVKRTHRRVEGSRGRRDCQGSKNSSRSNSRRPRRSVPEQPDVGIRILRVPPETSQSTIYEKEHCLACRKDAPHRMPQHRIISAPEPNHSSSRQLRVPEERSNYPDSSRNARWPRAREKPRRTQRA